MAYTNSLFLSKARVDLMKWIYGYVCKFKGVPKIEALSREGKNDLWSFVTELCDGKEVDNERKIDIARVFYTIEYFLNEHQ